MSKYLHVHGWLDSPVWGNIPYTEREAWSWIIGEAAYRDREVPGATTATPVRIYRGQLTASLRFMATKWGWMTGNKPAKDKVRRFLSKLERWGMISVATANATGGETAQNVITICNYNKYQFGTGRSETESATLSATGARQPRDKQEEILNIPKDKLVVASARDAPVSHETNPGRYADTVAVGKTIAAITGWDADPNWFGDYSRIEVWLKAGWDPDLDIIPTVRRLMVGRTSPPKVLKYFERAIADAYATRTSPIPKGSPNAAHHQKLTQHDRLEAAGREALDDIFAEIDSRFGESQSSRVGQPDPTKLRDIPRLRQAARSGEKHHSGIHDGNGRQHNGGNPGGLPDLDAYEIDNADPGRDFGNY